MLQKDEGLKKNRIEMELTGGRRVEMHEVTHFPKNIFLFLYLPCVRLI